MNIALVHYAAPPVVGGVETVLARQAQEFVQAGHQVKVLAGRGETWDARIPVEVLPEIDSRHPFVLKVKAQLDQGRVPEDFSALSDQVISMLRRSLAGVDVVIAHNVASLHKNLALTDALFRLSPEIPRLILWHHDLAWTAPRYLNELHPGWPWDLLCTPWPGARQVVVSDMRRQELAELMHLPPNSITVVPAGISLPEFLGISNATLALMNRLSLLEAGPIFLSPVRVTRRKNLELGLNILKAVKADFPSAALVITGPPGAHNPANLAYLEDLRSLRDRLGLAGSAHFLADVLPEGLSSEQVAEFYRLADALLLPSLEEGFGIPIIEAGLGRLPVFCTDLPTLRALAGEWATYFSPAADPLQTAALISRRLEDDPVFQLRQRVRQGYTWQAIFNRRIAPLLED